MPGTNYTTNLRLANPSLNDTGWGTTVSNGMIDLTDQAIAGQATADVTSADVTLSIVDGSAGVNSARNMFLRITGTPGVARSVIVPTNRKLYFVTNTCGQTVTVKVSGQTGVAVPDGASMTLRINAAGTDVVQAFSYAASMSLGTALGATSGGTGQASYAVGDLLYASSTTALSKLTVGATDAVLTVAAGIPSWVATLPVASGGTGAATLAANNVLLGNGTSAVQTVAPGTAGNLLTSNGTTWTSAAAPSSYSGVTSQVFTSNGTFTIPSGVTKVKVTVVGGGGGTAGGNSNAQIVAGGGGGAAIKWLTGLTPGNTLSVTVGAGGTAGTSAPTDGGAGGNSSVASGTQTITTITANGGSGGTGNTAIPGAGGSATNGDLNMPGSSAVSMSVEMSGFSVFSTPKYTLSAGNSIGGGGGGRSPGSGSATSGVTGAAGAVIFEW